MAHRAASIVECMNRLLTAPAACSGNPVSPVLVDPQYKGVMTMSVCPLRVRIQDPASLARPKAIEHVQHFVDDRPGPVGYGGKSGLTLQVITPESRAQEQS